MKRATGWQRVFLMVVMCVVAAMLAGVAWAEDLTTGLIAYYPFSGNANNVVENNYHGVIHGAPEPTPNRFGKANSAYLFNGTSDYIQLANTSGFHFSTPSTVSVWSKYTAINHGGPIIEKHDCGDANGWGIEIHEPGKPYFTFPSVNVIFSPTVKNDGDWHHYTGIYDGANISFYIDGSLVGSMPKTANQNIDLEILIGASTCGGYFDGTIDDLKIYNRALSAAEVDSLYKEIPSAGVGVPGTIVPTGNMLAGRFNHTATLLPDGNVLIAGGNIGSPSYASLSSAELYDPNTGAFTTTGSTCTTRRASTATLLNNGKVLITGGEGEKSAELYDPSTHSFTATGTMSDARSYHTATLLQNGKVMIVGGNNGDTYSQTAELYDPGSFPPSQVISLLAECIPPRCLPMATCSLQEGKEEAIR